MKLRRPMVGTTQLQLLVLSYLTVGVLTEPRDDYVTGRLTDTSSLLSDIMGRVLSSAIHLKEMSEHFMTTQDHLPVSSGFTTEAFKNTKPSHKPAASSSLEDATPVPDSSFDSTSASALSITPSASRASHPCLRECVVGAPPMTCYYHFEVDGYLSMSKACYNCPTNATDCDRLDCIPADGAKRPLFVVNRQLPGPSIEVCYGDRVVVNVLNLHMEQSVTIHWHGIHQVGTPYMDGVPHVTQCPIEPGESFRYDFKAIPAGTHFWHSHLGVQRANGLFGAFIVRIPTAQDPNAHLFDYDLPAHTIQVLDWDHVTSTEKFMDHFHGSGDNKPPTLLVNGRGRNYEVQQTSGANTNVYVPDVRFNVKKVRVVVIASA